MTRQLERALQRDIADKIGLTDLFTAFVIDVNPVPLRDEAGKVCGIRSTHADAGVADLFVQCKDGSCLWIEIKRKSGMNLSKTQCAWARKLREAGGTYRKATTVYEALMCLDDHCRKRGLTDNVLAAMVSDRRRA